MVKSGEEICLNDFELYVFRWFIERKQFDDKIIVEQLKQLVKKLEGTYNAQS